MTSKERKFVENRIALYRRLQADRQREYKALMEEEVLDVYKIDDARFAKNYYQHTADVLTELLRELDQLASE